MKKKTSTRKKSTRKSASTAKIQWQKHWKELSKKFDEAKTETTRIFQASQKKYHASLKDIESHRKKIKTDFHKLAGRSDVAWSDVKKGFKAALRDVDKAMKKALADFKGHGRSRRS